MATSGTYTATDTVQQIVTDALIELQVLSANQQPRDSDLQLGVRRLNWMLKEQDEDGEWVWRWDYEGADTILAATPTLTLDTPFRDILEARIVLPGGTERLLQRREWSEFASYPNKTTPGNPSIFVPRPGRDSMTLQFWPVPTSNTVVNFTGAKIAEDVTDPTQTIDVPARYTHTVMINLARKLINAFGKAGEPHAADIIAEAKKTYLIMRADDRPASYFMGPEGAARYGYQH
jgi:phenylpropionate dioxygenase-like ring-hydroxylating dioxygenase large terminal subunit